MRSWAFLIFLAGSLATAENKMVQVPAGTYTPFYPDKEAASGPVHVESFFMDVYPVTNDEYLQFVKHYPQWRKSKIKRALADPHYLKNWKRDLQFSDSKMTNSPITFVSWFSAKAYCESSGKTLPTVDQWEYAAYDNGRSEKELKERVLKWYSEPNPRNLPHVGSTEKNGFGIYDLQGLIWEWVYDFNSPTGGESGAFCGAGAGSAKDSRDYVSYMRFAFRSSLKGSYTTANLGFRCVKEVTK